MYIQGSRLIFLELCRVVFLARNEMMNHEECRGSSVLVEERKKNKKNKKKIKSRGYHLATPATSVASNRCSLYLRRRCRCPEREAVFSDYESEVAKTSF
jgi:hypothetical protein